MLRLCGAELVEVPALPYSNPNNYQHIGRRLADQLRAHEPNGVLFADQWNNLDNPKAHYESTGPEIWQQTNGKVDGFICSVGSGGKKTVPTPYSPAAGSLMPSSWQAARKNSCGICVRMPAPSPVNGSQPQAPRTSDAGPCSGGGLMHPFMQDSPFGRALSGQ